MLTHDYKLPSRIAGNLRARKYGACVEELRALAEGDNYAARIALADIYLRGGDGIQKDYREALRWLKTIRVNADDTGLAASMLAGIYGKGLGVEPDHRRAFKYLRRAILSGQRSGLLVAGIMLNRGDGTIKKPRTAQLIFRSYLGDNRMGVLSRLLALLYVTPWTKPLTRENQGQKTR